LTGAGVEPVDEAQGRRGYWDEYYSARGDVQRPLPSQFATFVANELSGPHRVIEFGCGTGRDSVFFALYGHDVTGVDGSPAAVRACEQLTKALGLPATFIAANIDSGDLADRLAGGEGPRLVYARFFVHAITDAEEESFLELAGKITDPGDLLAVEYRTLRDASGAKVTERHFRRFVTPAEFDARALMKGFDAVYNVEGFGFAKYKQDDAYVARAIFRKR
jgi:SAM-dependent methyltransferase